MNLPTIILVYAILILFVYFLYKQYRKRYPKKSNILPDIYINAHCSLLKYILLSIFTLGIWHCIWIHYTTKFLNTTSNTERYNPTNKLLLCIFIPFYIVFWIYKHCQKINILSQSKGINSTDTTSICTIIGIFSPILAGVFMQDKINHIIESKNNIIASKNITISSPSTGYVYNGSGFAKKQNNIEEIKKYKELLDMNIITQEEFDAKKKQLLGL